MQRNALNLQKSLPTASPMASAAQLAFPPCLRNISSRMVSIGNRSHPEMVGDMSLVTLNFDLSKNSFCAFLARVKTYTHTKN